MRLPRFTDGWPVIRFSENLTGERNRLIINLKAGKPIGTITVFITKPPNQDTATKNFIEKHRDDLDALLKNAVADMD